MGWLHRLSVLTLLASVALAASWLGGAAGDPERRATHASEDVPTIVLAASRRGAWGSGPLGNFDHPPGGVYFGYGLADADTGQILTMVFDEALIVPSPETQVFFAHVDTDPEANALADATVSGAPPGTALVFKGWLEGERGGGYDVYPIVLPRGAEVEAFRLTVSPFAIDVVPQVTPPDTQPYSVYMAMPYEDPYTMAVLEVLGPAPLGDATCDATTSSTDALVVLQRGAGLIATLPCEKAADVLADGVINVLDAQLILQYVAGLLDEL